MAERKILVIDDEAPARRRLLRFLGERSETFDTREAGNGLHALEILEQFKPEVIFLDVEMPGLSGFEMLQQLETRDFEVIFQTAYDQYAIRAFEESACDYLLKPFDRSRFDRALDRALAAASRAERLKDLEAALRKSETYLQKVVVRKGAKLIPLPVDQITCFVSRDHCTCLHAGATEYLVDLSIDRLEERLDPVRFVRLHRGNLVRTDAITAIKRGPNAQVALNNGMELPVSRNRRKALEKLGSRL